MGDPIWFQQREEAVGTSEVYLQHSVRGNGRGRAAIASPADEPAGIPARPLSVAHVGQSMVRAGVEQWLKALVRFLDPRWAKVEKCVAVCSDLVDPAVVNELPMPVVIGQAEAVRQAAGECDVLLCWGPAELGEWLRDCRPKLSVFVAHGEGMWTRRILNGCAPVIDHVVAVSERVRRRVCVGLPTTVIPNGVDTTHIAQTRSRDEVRRSLGFASDDFVLGYVGRYSAEKRAHAVLEAAALLPETYKALLVGWGPLEENLRRLAATWLPGRYAFAAAGAYLGDYYHAMDALCVVSETEGFSLAALEGMFCGVPLIVTPVGSVPEIIQDRVNGLVVAGTAGSIGDAAEMLRRHPAWAAGLAAEGRAYAQQHGHARAMARRYEILLDALWREKTSS
ncbi:MAG TPA: glycosyltransferase [Pirellulales bacterium]|nr:glycosyltransferase [Pirellulales bacterium]